MADSTVRRGASPLSLDPSFILLLYIWTLAYIRLLYLVTVILYFPISNFMNNLPGEMRLISASFHVA